MSKASRFVTGKRELDRASSASSAPAATTRPAARYSFEIDPQSDTTHAMVVRMVGRDRTVLELGPATGYMSKILKEQGCSVVGIEVDPAMAHEAERYCDRVIVGDIETIDLVKELGSQRFDVILAADVLEHLKDPLGVLQRLIPYLVDDSGFFVVSLPNIAHGSVRLSLLGGRFAYQDLGLLDRNHLRFFTRESIEQLLDEAELGIVELRRQELNIEASEVPFDTDAITDEVRRVIAQDPDAQTYQFVLKAYPLSHHGLRQVQLRLREQAFLHDATTRQLAQLRRELDQLREQSKESEKLSQALAAISAREGELRTALIDAHDQALRRDSEIERLTSELKHMEATQVEFDRLLEENRELWRAQNEARELIEARNDEIRMLRVRLARIVNSAPMRAWYRIGRLPLVRRLVARRTAAFTSTLERSDQQL
jgi:2-polyprenyl-3-methyl-5-hydroxy-6-metoxy-1,4-benzoquinol methylase